MWRTVLLEYVAPAAGFLIKQIMWIAPWGAVQESISKGELGDLNPMPWVFMMGSTMAFCVYGILIGNYWAFFANITGFLFSIYYNLQAVKLQFYGHNSGKLRESIVAALHESSGGADWKSVEPDTAVDFAQLVWGVASLNVPAPAPHDYFVMLMVLFWTILITVMGLAGLSPSLSASIAGYTVIVMKVLLCAAPVSVIFSVLRTCSSAGLHRPTLCANLADTFFWAAYGLAIQDMFIALPSLIGISFSIVLLSLAIVIPRGGQSGKGDDDDDKASVTSKLGLRTGSDDDVSEDSGKHQYESSAQREFEHARSQENRLSCSPISEDIPEDASIDLLPEDGEAEPGVSFSAAPPAEVHPEARPGIGTKSLSMRMLTSGLLPQTYISKQSSFRVIHNQNSFRVLQRQDSMARNSTLNRSSSLRSVKSATITKSPPKLSKTKSSRF